MGAPSDECLAGDGSQSRMFEAWRLGGYKAMYCTMFWRPRRRRSQLNSIDFGSRACWTALFSVLQHIMVLALSFTKVCRLSSRGAGLGLVDSASKTYIYIYIERERERFKYIYIYIYIYIYTYNYVFLCFSVAEWELGSMTRCFHSVFEHMLLEHVVFP